MSDQTQNTDQTPELTEEQQAEREKQELQVLKGRADMLGIKYSNNIKVETLREKIKEKTEAGEDLKENARLTEAAASKQINPLQEAEEGEVTDFSGWTKLEREMYARKRAQKEALKLIRIRVANLDPKKKDIPAEIFTTGNRFIGTVKKLVPFGEATDNGYHVPYCIYEMMKSRKFLQISTKRNKSRGANETRTRWVPEFAIEVLPPLTEDDLTKLAVEQQASGRLNGNDD